MAVPEAERNIPLRLMTYSEIEIYRDHPFRDEFYSDGNYYPWHSKVRPLGVTTVYWSDGHPISPVCPGNAPASEPIQSAEPQKLS